MTAPSERKFERSAPEDGPEAACRPRPCWQTILLGLAAGCGGSLIGVGGGIIMVPVLTIWGLTQKRAQGTSLVVIFALVPVSIYTYWRLGNIDFGFAVPLAIGGVVGSMLGSDLALRFSNRLLARLFGVFLILIALRLIFVPGLPEHHVAADLADFTRLVETTLLGVLAGMAAGFFGVGGGVIFVPTGVLLAGLQQAFAQGSSLTAMFPTTLVGIFNYHRKREIEWSLVWWMIPGAWLGAVIGSWGADVLGKIREGRVLTIVFALFLLYTGAAKLIGAAHASQNLTGRRA